MAAMVGHPVTQMVSKGSIRLLSPDTDNASLSAAVSMETQHGGGGFQERFTLFLWQVVPPSVILLGTAGNTLSFLVMRRRRLSDTRMSLCLRLLAVVDTIVLWTGYLRYWVWKTFGSDIRSSARFMCNFQSWLVALSSQFAAWIIICITIDRLAAIFFPHFAKRNFSKLKTAIVLLVVAVFLALVNSHFFWSIKMNKDGFCDINTDIKWLADFFRYVWPWVDLCLYSIIPSVIIILSNTAIILKIHMSRRKRSYLTQRQQLSRSRVNSMTSTLMVISFMYLLTTLPISTFMIIHISNINKLSSSQWMWFAVVNFLSYLNSASNFILYLISSSFFRAELLDMLCCGRIRSKQLALEGPLVASSSNGVARFHSVPPGGASNSQGGEDLIPKEMKNNDV